MLAAERENKAQTDTAHPQRADDPISDALLGQLLQGVSRTFALTIPQLPERLYPVVANAYLLCRIVDTIEDEPALDAAQKRYFCDLFSAVTRGGAPARGFAEQLHPLLSQHTLTTERELIRQTPGVIAMLHGFNQRQRRALIDCVSIMAEGMAGFQRRADRRGLENLAQLDQYCYYVAGVVGEMLTELFCDYDPAINAHCEELRRLAVSFGQGLQMTNILKDIWDDLDKGVCWLPRDLFEQAGFDLHRLTPGEYTEAFGAGLEQLIGIASGHLANALRYTMLIPRQQSGIRNFCLWALGMAVLTLRKINHHRNFRCGAEVKITRRSVRATVLVSRLSASHDGLLRMLFRFGQIGMPGQVSLDRSGDLPGERIATAGQQTRRT